MRLVAILFALMQEPVAQEDLLPGLVGQYHLLARLAALPENPDRDPRFRRVDRQIKFEKTYDAFQGTKLRDGLFIRWKGVLRAPRDGKYVFYTRSDDGSRLWIDGKRVVDNDGTHEMKEEDGGVELKAGLHDIRVDYFNAIGHNGITVAWQGPGLEKEPLPEKVLFHRKREEPTPDQLRGIELPAPGEGERDRAPRAEPPREKPVEKPAEKPVEKPTERPFPVDEAVVAKSEKQPDLGGRVISAFEDGPLLLVTIQQAGQELVFYLPKDAAVGYVGLEKPDQKPRPGYTVYVWLKPDSKDTAASVRFARAK